MSLPHRLVSAADAARSHSSVEPEQCVILRLPQAAAAELSNDIDNGVNLRDKLTIESKPDLRNFTICYANQLYDGSLLDLPCIVETLKTTDNITFYKAANISQMLICTQGDDTEQLQQKLAAAKRKHQDSSERQYQWDHGLTPPLKNVRKRRFRRTLRNRFMDMPDLEKEVKRILRSDVEASEVKWELVKDEPKLLQQTEQSESQEEQQQQQQQQQQQEQQQPLQAQDEEASNAAKALELFGDISSDSDGPESSSPSPIKESGRDKAKG